MLVQHKGVETCTTRETTMTGKSEIGQPQRNN